MRALPVLRLRHPSDHASPLSLRLARRLVFAIDSVQRRRHHVFEFEHDPGCILRLAQGRSREDRSLSDGTVVRQGDPILEIHFWNEHIPLMGRNGPCLDWGLQFYGRLHRSLHDLALYVACRPEFDAVVAIRGESSFAAAAGWQRYARLIRRFGFDFVHPPPAEAADRMACFWESLYVWLIIWALHPVSLKGRSFVNAERCEIWISRSELLRRYGLPNAELSSEACALDPLLPEKRARTEAAQAQPTSPPQHASVSEAAAARVEAAGEAHFFPLT